jgi:hypothetical protein
MPLSADILSRMRSLAAQGHNTEYIAEALNRARVPTPSGQAQARWHRETVRRLAVRHGIRVGSVAH